MLRLVQREVPNAVRRRLFAALGVALLGFLVLLGRLWNLQILQGEELRASSDGNRIRLRRVQATRGTVLDRHGRVLIDSRPSFDAVLVPEDARDLGLTLETLGQLLGQSPAEIRALLAQTQGRPPFEEIVIRRDLSWEEVVALETHQPELPGVSLRITPRRLYPLATELAHVLGYVGEAGPADLAADPRYRMGDLVGKAGLERRWERYLRGENGGQQVEVDALGRKLKVLREVEETPGNSVTLTIDVDLQQAAAAALGGRAGSIVALDPRTGDVLAMVSHPSFDPNLFARGIRRGEWRALMTDRERPLNNRAIQGQYPPGSTFKIIVAAAALEEGVINPFTRITCRGGVPFGNRYFRCWKKGGHGSLNVHGALVHSCDVFFYQVAQRLGVDVIARYARAFGLGMPTGIGLDHEQPGTIPDTAWKQARFRQPWFAGETLSVAIGQGYVTATPLQMATAMAATAVGARYRPRLVQHVETPEGERIHAETPERTGTLALRETTLRQIRDALRDVVARGTGKNARVPGMEVAGKTGTSQVVRLGKQRLKARQLPRHHRDHAWFVAYAPADDPQIAVAAVVEHADGGGGAVAAPIVRQVLERFVALRAERDRVYAQNRPATHRAF